MIRTASMIIAMMTMKIKIMIAIIIVEIMIIFRGSGEVTSATILALQRITSDRDEVVP